MNFSSNLQFPSTKAIYISAFALSILGGILYNSDWNTLRFQNNLGTQWKDIFTMYAFIIVAIERSAAVWVGIRRNEMSETWKARVRRLDELFEEKGDKEATIKNLSSVELFTFYKREFKISEKLDKDNILINPLEEPSGVDDEPDRIYKSKTRGYLRQVRLMYSYQFDQYKRETNDRIAKTVFIVGLILSVVGLSLLNDLINVTFQDKDLLQRLLYRITDIFITGGLLGGGSVGLTKLFNSINNVLSKK